RPAEALTFLQPLREKKPDDVRTLAEMVRAYAALKDKAAALKIIDEMGKSPESVTERLELGKALVSSGEDMVAGVVFGQVLGGDPANLSAQIGLAQVQIHQYLPEPAWKGLICIRPTPAVYRQWMLVWAEYHQLVGEYFQSRQRYVEL